MITRQEAIEGLYGAWRLFLRDPGAVALFDDSPNGFFKSFFCAVLVLPAYILLAALGPGAVEPTRGILATLVVEASAYVIGWVAWPLVMAHVAPLIGRERQYRLYIVAFNWSNAVQIGLFLSILLLNLAGVVPDRALPLVNLIALIVAIFYHMFILRVTMDLRGLGAFGLVFGEFVLGQFIFGLRTTLLL